MCITNFDLFCYILLTTHFEYFLVIRKIISFFILKQNKKWKHYEIVRNEILKLRKMIKIKEISTFGRESDKCTKKNDDSYATMT